MNPKKSETIFFDSNVYINLLRYPEYARKVERFYQGTYLYTVSKIVLMELWAGVKTKSEESILKQIEQSLPLLDFSDNNFIVAGHVMRKMAESHKVESSTRRRLTWDILIALNAKEQNALLVTDNEFDFKKIQKFINFEFITSND